MTQTLHGSCHCKAVVFEVDVDEAPLEVERCNCSICNMGGYLHLIVPASRFRLMQGEEDLATYSFNTGVAKHRFCRTCGIKPFYIPRSNPDGVDVNVNCLETEGVELNIVEFDGRNWEQHAHKLAHKSLD